jgi:hypothetical protein
MVWQLRVVFLLIMWRDDLQKVFDRRGRIRSAQNNQHAADGEGWDTDDGNIRSPDPLEEGLIADRVTCRAMMTMGMNGRFADPGKHGCEGVFQHKLFGHGQHA